MYLTRVLIQSSMVCHPLECYTPMVYVDRKVHLPLPKQDIAKHPKSHKTDQTDIIAAFYKRQNVPRDRLPLL